MFNYHCHLNHTNSAQKTVITHLRLREMVSGDSPCVVIHRSSDDVVKSLCYRLHTNITVLLTLSKILTSMPIKIKHRLFLKNHCLLCQSKSVLLLTRLFDACLSSPQRPLDISRRMSVVVVVDDDSFSVVLRRIQRSVSYSHPVAMR